MSGMPGQVMMGSADRFGPEPHYGMQGMVVDGAINDELFLAYVNKIQDTTGTQNSRPMHNTP